MKRNPKDDPELHKDEDEKDEAEGEGEGEGEDEEMEKKIKKAKKSVDLSENDLQQSLDKLVTLAGDDADSRKQVLLSKAQEVELSKAEQAELFNLLGGQEEKDETLGEEIIKGLEENDTLQKALDVSDYLQEQHTELVKSLQAMGDALAKSDNRQHEFNLVLAKAMSQMGQHIVTMSERLGVIEQQPVRGPKSKGLAPLSKSFANRPGDGEGMSKSQILDAMDEMTQVSFEKGMSGVAVNGEDLSVAISKYEQFNTLSPAMLAQVKAHIESKGATTH